MARWTEAVVLRELSSSGRVEAVASPWAAGEGARSTALLASYLVEAVACSAVAAACSVVVAVAPCQVQVAPSMASGVAEHQRVAGDARRTLPNAARARA